MVARHPSHTSQGAVDEGRASVIGQFLNQGADRLAGQAARSHQAPQEVQDRVRRALELAPI
eukprot:13605583-Alexandrium_andersonii.AAC.1